MTFLQARWYTPADTRSIRLLCLHDVEVAEKPTTAELVAGLFHTWDRKASAHEVIDCNSVVQCVLDKDVAYAAAGANRDGKHYELAGYASQTADQWLDAYGQQLLPIVADRVAADCVRYNVPPVRLTVEQLRDKRSRGITHHADVERAWPSTGHHDVGDGFPWDYFLALVRQRVAALTNPGHQQEDDDMDRTCTPSWGARQTNGRVPFFRVDDALDVSPTAVRVLAMNGAAQLAQVDGNAFGIPFMLVKPTSKASGLDEWHGSIVLCCNGGETYDVAAKP